MDEAGSSKVPPKRTWIWFLLILALNYFLVRSLFPSDVTPVPYTLFKEEVEKKNVEAIYSWGETITGQFVKPIMYPPKKEAAPDAGESENVPADGGRLLQPPVEPQSVERFTTTLPVFVDPGLEAFLIDHGVEIRTEPIQEGGSPLLTLLFGFGPALLLIGFYVWMYRRAAGQEA